jgi:hypothetical protein
MAVYGDKPHYPNGIEYLRHRAAMDRSPATSGRSHWPGRLSCMTGTLKMLALSSAADGAAWAVLGPCGNRR